MFREAIAMRQQECLSRGAGVITGTIMDQKHVRLGLIQDHLQEGLVTCRVKPALDTLIEQPPREIFNSAKDLVAFALPAGGDLGLIASSGPRVAQRAPLGKAGLICKQDQTFAPCSSP